MLSWRCYIWRLAWQRNWLCSPLLERPPRRRRQTSKQRRPQNLDLGQGGQVDPDLSEGKDPLSSRQALCAWLLWAVATPSRVGGFSSDVLILAFLPTTTLSNCGTEVSSVSSSSCDWMSVGVEVLICSSLKFLTSRCLECRFVRGQLKP